MRQVRGARWVWVLLMVLMVTAGCEFGATEYTLNVSTRGSGSVSPSGGTYDADTAVTLTATAASGWVFAGWSGDVSGSSTMVQLTMDSDKNVTATFNQVLTEQYTLTVMTRGNGSVSPAGGTYDAGTTVTLTATPDAGWAFSGWSGDALGTSSRTQVTLWSDLSVTAMFVETDPGGGEDDISYQAEDLSLYNAVVESEHSGYTGSGYVNYANETGSAMGWNITAGSAGNADLTFRFANGSSAVRPMDIQVNGSIQVPSLSFTPTGSWTSWENVRATVYLANGTNEIRVVSAGAAGGPNMDRVRVTGDFPDVAQYTLTVDSIGNGSVSPSGGTYVEGSTVTLTATPASGWVFESWSGDAAGSSRSISLTMTSDLYVSAHFFESSVDPGELLAFPGAEGFGRLTSGGRGGTVVHVTNLNDSGPGSFRDAVSQSHRIVVFDVGGVIRINERIVIHSDIYVAGQTAPGGGITLYGNGIALNGDSGNNIIRYIRIRMGKNGDSGKDAVGISAGQNYMFDHVSISWGRDGTLDVNGSGIDNLTFQDCIIAQGINNSNHSTGGLMQSGKWSMIRSLYIDNKTRNPKARGSHEFINSVLYNWASNGYIMGDTSGVSQCNLVGNYFIYGPSSSSNTHITNTTPTFYVYGEDNWVDSNKNGVLDGSLLSDYKTATVMRSAFDYPGVNTLLSARNALQHVIDQAGASLLRDEVDEFLIDQVLSYGTRGQIINTEDDNGIPGNVGTVANGTPERDSDGDGMPDTWERERGLNPYTADDSGDDDRDGYTNIEEYLSCLAGDGDLPCP